MGSEKGLKNVRLTVHSPIFALEYSMNPPCGMHLLTKSCDIGVGEDSRVERVLAFPRTTDGVISNWDVEKRVAHDKAACAVWP